MTTTTNPAAVWILATSYSPDGQILTREAALDYAAELNDEAVYVERTERDGVYLVNEADSNDVLARCVVLGAKPDYECADSNGLLDAGILVDGEEIGGVTLFSDAGNLSTWGDGPDRWMDRRLLRRVDGGSLREVAAAICAAVEAARA